MNLLLDTHLLLWFAQGDAALSDTARILIEDPQNEIFFSTVSLWECAIKFGLGKTDFTLHPAELRGQLLTHGFSELVLYGDHAIELLELPTLHRDPFDRILVAQALVEKLTLLTSDVMLARYPGTRLV
jgi:PIN domain nuclease of toxin-antitoxin system